MSDRSCRIRPLKGNDPITTFSSEEVSIYVETRSRLSMFQTLTNPSTPSCRGCKEHQIIGANNVIKNMVQLYSIRTQKHIVSKLIRQLIPQKHQIGPLDGFSVSIRTWICWSKTLKTSKTNNGEDPHSSLQSSEKKPETRYGDILYKV